jgi:cell wall-associated NlpC family hydrolase
LIVRLAVGRAPDPATAGGSGLSRSLAEQFVSGVQAAPFEPSSGACHVPGVMLRWDAPLATNDRLGERVFHRRAADLAYAGIRDFALKHRDELDIERRRRGHACETAESQPVPLYPTGTREERRGRAARQLWPEGDLPPQRARWFADLYRRVLLSDRTIFYFEPEVTNEGNQVVLGGATTDLQVAHGLVKAFGVVGLEVDNRMRLLPDREALGGKLYGVCAIPMARTFMAPSESSGPQTQVSFGEPLFLLDARGDYLLAQANDGYWGWLRRDAVKTLEEAEFRRYLNSRFALLMGDLGAGDLLLRRGARLLVEGAHGDRLDFSLATGGRLQANRAQVELVDPAPRAEKRVLAALELLYTPYVFGARSTTGLDCSGLVGSVGELAGLAPARDAAQQCLSGRLVATRWLRDNLQPGDQLYFIDESGKIFHTGLALNATHFVHASPPEVQISSLKPGDRLYNPHWDETFFCAKRH